MKPCDLDPGDVVQIDPVKVDDPAVRGCLMIVRKAEAWGVIGAIPVPTFEEGDEHVRLLIYRATWDQIEVVGRAAWGDVVD